MNIALDQIRKQAPEGATHYADDNLGFDYILINKHGKVYVWSARYSEWLPVFSTPDHKLKPLN